MKRTLLAAALLPLVLLARPASAAEKSQTGQYVDLSQMALPITVDGRLRNYIFIKVRLLLRPNADANALREKEPFFRDALVRAAQGPAFVVPEDWTRLDDAKLKASVLRDAKAIAGPGAVTGVQITSETPQRSANLSPLRKPAPGKPL